MINPPAAALDDLDDDRREVCVLYIHTIRR